MKPTRSTPTRFLAALAASLLFGSAVPGPGLASQGPQPPPDGPMAPPPPKVPGAHALSERWIELELPETAYDPAFVGDPGNYEVTGSDPVYAAGLHPVVANYRHFPEEARYAPQHDGSTDVALYQITYRVHLELPAPLSPGSNYELAVAPEVGVGGPFEFAFDAGAPNNAIHANQEAYPAKGPKVAYLSWWTGQGAIDFSLAKAFEVRDAVTGQTVFAGAVIATVEAGNEIWSDSHVFALDFSGLETPGTYYLYVPTVGRSNTFEIGNEAFARTASTVLRGITMQRDGKHGLDDPAITAWHRPPAHVDDAVDEATGKAVDLVGGHMDAGDRGHYPHNSADMASTMLSAIILYPAEVEAFGESLELPESGNGVPDLLDEVAYELDWLVKAVMNTSAGGTLPFYLRPANGGYELYEPPEGDTGRVFFTETQGPNRSETLFAAGALAMAANTPLIQTYMPERAAAYLEAALVAFEAFEAHADSNAFWKDAGWYDPWTEGPDAWSDEMLVAAANLLEVTGEAKYVDWLESALPEDLRFVRHWGWTTSGPWLPAFVALAKGDDPQLDAGIRQAAVDAIIWWADGVFQHDGQAYDAPFGVPLPWHVNQVVGWHFTGAHSSFPLMLAYAISGDDKYRDQIVRDWNWLLGTNPQSRTFISGLGRPDRRPRWQVHEISQYQWAEHAQGAPDGWSEMAPGIPSADIQAYSFPWYLDDPWNQARKFNTYPEVDADYPALYRYQDSWHVSNEFTIERLARGAVSLVPFLTKLDEPTPEPADAVTLSFSGPARYANSGSLVSGDISVQSHANGSVRSITGSGKITGASGAMATVSVNVRQLWFLPLYFGMISVHDSGAGHSSATPIIGPVIPLGPSGAAGVEWWIWTKTFPWQSYTLEWSVQDLA